jgi:gas vesicle protein
VKPTGRVKRIFKECVSQRFSRSGCIYFTDVKARWQKGRKEVKKMKRFITGVLLGLGIGLLVAPMSGEEARRQLAARFNELLGYIPENEQLNEYVQQVTDRVSQTGSNLKDYAQQAVSKVRDTGSSLGELGQKAGTDVKQAGQDVVETTKQTVQPAKQSAQTDKIDTAGSNSN